MQVKLKNDYHCRQCGKRKPPKSFEWVTMKSRNGTYYPAPRKICKMCCGDEGHKPCQTCGEDLAITEFYWMTSSSSDIRRPMRDCKACWKQIKKARRRGLKTPTKKRSGPIPGLGLPKNNSRRPPGWTPPPSLEELAMIHSRYRPPEGWTRPKGEF